MGIRTQVHLALYALIGVAGCASAPPPPPNITFAADSLDERAATHKNVAVLPFLFETNRDHEAEKGATPIDAAAEGRKYQRMMYARIIDHSDDAGHTVGFQDVDRTNAILAGDGRDVYAIHREELCSLLGVDAVLSGTVANNKQETLSLG